MRGNTCGRPRIDVLAHWRRRGDGEDERAVAQRVRDVRSGLVTVETLHFKLWNKTRKKNGRKDNNFQKREGGDDVTGLNSSPLGAAQAPRALPRAAVVPRAALLARPGVGGGGASGDAAQDAPFRLSVNCERECSKKKEKGVTRAHRCISPRSETGCWCVRSFCPAREGREAVFAHESGARDSGTCTHPSSLVKLVLPDVRDLAVGEQVLHALVVCEQIPVWGKLCRW